MHSDLSGFNHSNNLMNYYAARIRQSDNKWDFTCQNDNRVWSVGYCAGFPKPLGENEIRYLGGEEGYRRWLEKLEPFRSKFHENGHATQEEAENCYRSYLLDHRLNMLVQFSNTHKCEVCEVWTDKAAVVDNGHAYHLCDTHRTREEVESRFPRVSRICSSY